MSMNRSMVRPGSGTPGGQISLRWCFGLDVPRDDCHAAGGVGDVGRPVSVWRIREGLEPLIVFGAVLPQGLDALGCRVDVEPHARLRRASVVAPAQVPDEEGASALSLISNFMTLSDAWATI